MLLNASGRGAGGRGQAGLSKQWDFAVTQEILRAYGDVVKDPIRKVLRAGSGREDGMEVTLPGWIRSISRTSATELQDAQQLLGLGMESPTLKKEIFKKVALKYLCDARQDVKDRIAEEIEA